MTNECIQCGELSKYKCPTCRQPYCSVVCCKKHKETPCSAPPEIQANTPQELPTRYDFSTEDTVPPEKLKLLEQSTELKKCLENPHVRNILKELDKSPHPDALLQKYMLEPIFIEFVDVCLPMIEPKEDNGEY